MLLSILFVTICVRDEQNENWTTTTTTQSTCEEWPQPQPQPQFDLITHPNNNINPIFLQYGTTTPTQFFSRKTPQPNHNTIFLLNSPQFVVPPQFYHKNWVIITGEKLPQPPPQLNFWTVNTTTTTKTPQNNFGGNQPLFVVLTIVQQSLRDTKLRKMVPYLNSHKITENLFIPLEIIIFMQIYGIFFHVTILKLKYLYKM